MKIELLRAEKPWTQEGLAEACGLNVRTIQRAESGQTISGRSLKKIARALGVDMSKLDIGTVTLDTSLIDRKMATQFGNVKVSKIDTNTKIVIYFRSVASSLRFVLAAATAAFLCLTMWIVSSAFPVALYAVVIIILSAPFSIYGALKARLGKITIDISPKSLRRQLHIGTIKLADRSFDADLLSDFEVCTNKLPFREGYYLQFQYGFKATRMDMTNLEAEARFVVAKIEDALESI